MLIYGRTKTLPWV